MMPACEKKSDLGRMSCIVSSTEESECQSLPTLTKGVLTIHQNYRFDLTGDYVSCFESSSVQIAGKYRYKTTASEVIEMELSAESIVQNGDEKTEFPRTIAVINLDKNSGQGNFIDIWSNIRMKGLVKQDTIAKTLQCKLLQ